MTEQEILAYFNNRIAPPPSQNLHRIQILCHALGDPQKKLAGKIIHVAGTNGKGSVCAFLDAILRAAGKHTGLYISPFIHRFEERIQIDKTPVSLDEIATYIPQLRAAELSLYAQTGERAGHFELLTVLAYLLFAAHSCNAVVLETGLGGRLDPTNLCEPALCIITHIALDHTEQLGNTHMAIAAEKAGIIKPNVPVVIYPQQTNAAMQTLLSKAKELRATAILPDIHKAQLLHADADGLQFVYQQQRYETKLCGLYQMYNALCAITAAQHLGIPNKAIVQGLCEASFPARFETISRMPRVIFDGAHNADGLYALRKTIDCYFTRPLIGICAMLRDKDPQTALSCMLDPERFQCVFCLTPPSPRGMDGAELASLFRHHGVTSVFCDTPYTACQKALELASCDDVILAFGSLYLAATIKDAVATLL